MNKTIRFAGAQISYTILGKGASVLLLHGFGEDSSIWDDVLPSLSNYRLIIPDLPGSGKSCPLEQEKIFLSDFAACIAEILANENLESVHFIGHSMGGYIAMEFASLYPERLKSICLFHSSAFADDFAKIETRKKGIEFIRENGVSAFLKTSIPGLFKDAGQHRSRIDELLKAGKKFSAVTLIQYYEAMIARKDHSTLLSSIQIPVLFVIGEHDKAVPLEISLKQCYLPCISFVHILRGSAHMGMCEEPDKITRALQNFLIEVIQG